jgi:hypothetical protein
MALSGAYYTFDPYGNILFSGQKKIKSNMSGRYFL